MSKKTSKTKELVILIGAPGSGKTTYCKKSLPDYLRISQDEMGRKGHRQAFRKAIEDGVEKIVVDRMNFNSGQRWRYIQPAQQAGYKIKAVFFKFEMNKCFERVTNREDHPTIAQGDLETAKKAIMFYYNNYEYPEMAEGYEHIEEAV